MASRRKPKCPVCEDWGIVKTKPGALYLYKDCPRKCRAWLNLHRDCKGGIRGQKIRSRQQKEQGYGEGQG